MIKQLHLLFQAAEKLGIEFPVLVAWLAAMPSVASQFESDCQSISAERTVDALVKVYTEAKPKEQ
jgi:hypothetical protein